MNLRKMPWVLLALFLVSIVLSTSASAARKARPGQTARVVPNQTAIINAYNRSRSPAKPAQPAQPSSFGKKAKELRSLSYSVPDVPAVTPSWGSSAAPSARPFDSNPSTINPFAPSTPFTPTGTSGAAPVGLSNTPPAFGTQTVNPFTPKNSFSAVGPSSFGSPVPGSLPDQPTAPQAVSATGGLVQTISATSMTPVQSPGLLNKVESYKMKTRPAATFSQARRSRSGPSGLSPTQASPYATESPYSGESPYAAENPLLPSRTFGSAFSVDAPSPLAPR
jgi:hypothetical protein